MNFQDIWTVAKKELRAIFTDKVILLQVVILPFAIVFGYAMLMTVMAESASSDTESAESAFCINAPDYMREAFKEAGISSADEKRTDELKQQVKEKSIDVLIVFPKDFEMTMDPQKSLSNVEIWYNSERNTSISMYQVCESLLNAFQPKAFTVNADENVKYDYGSENAIFFRLIGMIFPVMIFMAIFMVCMNLAAESISGDKERGFLNTLLVTPVKRSSIAAGKSLSIFIAAITGSISAFVGMALSLPNISKSMEIGEDVSYSFIQYLQLFGITLTAIFFLTSILLIISTLAKDVKQATTIAPIVMMVFMLAGMFTLNDDFMALVEDFGFANYFIPAWNSMLMMKDIIKMDYSVLSVVVTCSMNLVLTFIAIFIVGKLFDHENIING